MLLKILVNLLACSHHHHPEESLPIEVFFIKIKQLPRHFKDMKDSCPWHKIIKRRVRDIKNKFDIN